MNEVGTTLHGARTAYARHSWAEARSGFLEALPEGVEHGYPRSTHIDAAIAAGDFDGAIDLSRSVGRMAEQFRDETLCAVALVGEGIARIKQGRVAEGLAVLDEAMLPVVAGRVRPAYAGNIYCQLMSVCYELSDLRRAEQWTDATTRWCEGFSNAVMFLGVCRVHRAQLLQVRGEWERAEEEIRLVRDELARMNVVAVGLALYELAELRRCRGDLAGAEEAYADAHRHGRDPQPGLARLRSAQGDHDQALEALGAAEAATVDPLARTRLWDALVEVALAAGDLATARRASAALGAAAETYASSGLVAAATLARGHVALADGDMTNAVEALRRAREQWQALDAPVRVAHARALLARAYEAVGNRHAAALERAAAEQTRRRLGIVSPPAPSIGPSPASRRRWLDTWPTSSRSWASALAPRLRHTRTPTGSSHRHLHSSTQPAPAPAVKLHGSAEVLCPIQSYGPTKSARHPGAGRRSR